MAKTKGGQKIMTGKYEDLFKDIDYCKGQLGSMHTTQDTLSTDVAVLKTDIDWIKKSQWLVIAGLLVNLILGIIKFA